MRRCSLALVFGIASLTAMVAIADDRAHEAAYDRLKESIVTVDLREQRLLRGDGKDLRGRQSEHRRRRRDLTIDLSSDESL